MKDVSKEINSKINKNEADLLARILKYDKNEKKLVNTDINNILFPFNKILASYFTNDYTKITATLEYLTEENYWMIPIFRRIILKAISLKFKENKEEDISGLLMNIYRRHQKCENKRFIFFIIILLLQIYSKKNKFSLFGNLISVVNPPNLEETKNCKEFGIFYYFVGIYWLQNDDFVKGNENLRKAFKYKFIRQETALPFYISQLLINKRIKKEVLRKYNLNSQFFESIYKGRYKHSDLNTKELIELNLLRCCKVNFPILNLRNSVFVIYKIAGNNFRLQIDFLRIFMKKEVDEIIGDVISLIDSGLLKGYLSINRECVVFSKVDPFPSILK